MRARRTLRSLGRLCALLADRGVTPSSAAGALFWVDARGAVALGPIARLARDAGAVGGVDLVRALAFAGLSVADMSKVERAAFALGLLEGAPATAHRRSKARIELRHG
jgi:hypothetical protein